MVGWYSKIWRMRGANSSSAGTARQHAKEGLDVRVGGDIPVAVEVRRVAGRAAVPGEAGEEGLDVRVRVGITVVIEVVAAVAADRTAAPSDDAAGRDAARGIKVASDDEPVIPRQQAEHAGERRRSVRAHTPRQGDPLVA